MFQVAGLTIEEAKAKLQPNTEEMLAQGNLTIVVPQPTPTLTSEDDTQTSSDTSEQQSSAVVQITDEEGSDEISAENSSVSGNKQVYTPEKSGIFVDIDTTLNEAMEFSKSQTKVNEETPVQNFDMKYGIVEETLSASLQADAPSWKVEPQSAYYTLETTSDEESETTSAQPVKTEGTVGLEVNTQQLTTDIVTAVQSEDFDITKEITAPTTEIQPETTTEDLSDFEVIGRYQTDINNSTDNRMWNIWKISSILNGTTVAPG